MLDETTNRRQALYSYLLSRGEEWTSMEEAAKAVAYYPESSTIVFHNSWPRRLLTGDIEAINNSELFDKIIVSGSRGIKLADEKEYTRFVNSELKEIFSKLRRVRKIARKASRDQQIDLEGKIAEAFLRRE